MMATNDSTTLATVSRPAKIGRSADMKRGTPGVFASFGPPTRLMITKATTGMAMPPIAPSGSRRKILISSQARRHKPRSIIVSVADRVAGELEKDVLERRQLGAKVVHRDAMLGEAVDHLRHQIGAAAADGDDLAVPRDGRDARDGAEPGLGRRIAGRDDDGAIGAMTGDERGRRADVHDAPVIDDRDAIAEALGL